MPSVQDYYQMLMAGGGNAPAGAVPPMSDIFQPSPTPTPTPGPAPTPEPNPFPGWQIRVPSVDPTSFDNPQMAAAPQGGGGLNFYPNGQGGYWVYDQNWNYLGPSGQAMVSSEGGGGLPLDIPPADISPEVTTAPYPTPTPGPTPDPYPTVITPTAPSDVGTAPGVTPDVAPAQPVDTGTTGIPDVNYAPYPTQGNALGAPGELYAPPPNQWTQATNYGNIPDLINSVLSPVTNLIKAISGGVPKDLGGFGQPAGYFGVGPPPGIGEFGVGGTGTLGPQGITYGDIQASGVTPRAVQSVGAPSGGPQIMGQGSMGNLGSFAGPLAMSQVYHALKGIYMTPDVYYGDYQNWAEPLLEFNRALSHDPNLAFPSYEQYVQSQQDLAAAWRNMTSTIAAGGTWASAPGSAAAAGAAPYGRSNVGAAGPPTEAK